MLAGDVMTRTYYVEIFCQADLTGQRIEEHLDEVMIALQEEPGATDIDLGASLAAGHIDFCVHLEAEGNTDAISKALTLVRSALHGLGASTPGWEGVMAEIDAGGTAVAARPADVNIDTPRPAQFA